MKGKLEHEKDCFSLCFKKLEPITCMTRISLAFLYDDGVYLYIQSVNLSHDKGKYFYITLV